MTNTKRLASWNKARIKAPVMIKHLLDRLVSINTSPIMMDAKINSEFILSIFYCQSKSGFSQVFSMKATECTPQAISVKFSARKATKKEQGVYFRRS